MNFTGLGGIVVGSGIGVAGLLVGSLAFVEKVKRELGVKAMHRAATEVDGTFTLREPREAYMSVFAGKNDVLRLNNSRFYEEKSEIQNT